MGSYQRKAPPQRRAALGTQQKSHLISALLVDRRTFETARQKLRPEHFSFDGEERVFRLIWTAVVDWYETYNDVPHREGIEANIYQRLEEDPRLLSKEEIEFLIALIDSAFELVIDDRKRKYITALLKSFLEERLQQRIQTLFAGDTPTGLPALFEEFLNESRAYSEITHTNKLDIPFPVDIFSLPTIEKEPIGISFLDRFLNGGWASGEIYGLCAQYGSCKTLLALQIANAAAVAEQARVRERGGDLKTCRRAYVVSYEDPQQSMQIRSLSNYAQVSRLLLEDKYGRQKLSTSRTLKDYERQRFREQIAAGLPVFGEKERIEQAMKTLNVNVRLIDFTGGEFCTNQAASTEFVEGILAVIKADQAACGNPGVLCVIVDYALAAARRYILSHKIDIEAMRHVLTSMPGKLAVHIARPYRCPIWLFHQLNTEQQGRTRGNIDKMTAPAEAKSFYENCDFGFNIGPVDNRNMALISMVKQRRAARQPDTILYVDGEFCTVREASNKYTIQNGRIVDSIIARQISDTDEIASLDRSEDVAAAFDAVGI